MIWDSTAQLLKICTGVNTWTQITGGGGGGGATIQVNGSNTASQTTINFTNSNPFNGLTATFTNPGFGTVQLGFSGTLGDGGITGPYSGVGACGTSTWAKTLNRNAIQTCTQPAFTDIASQIGLAQLPTIASTTFLGNMAGSPATPTAVAGVGGGTNPLLVTLTGFAQGQIICGNSTPVAVNCTPGIPVVQLTSSATISNVNRATMDILNSGGALAMTLPSPASLPNSYFADYYNVNSGTATFTSSGGTFLNCSGPGSATTQTIPPGWFGILYNDGTNYCLPAIPTDAAIPTTTGTQALGFNGSIFTAVSISGNCSGTFAAHTACINNTGSTAAPTQGAIGTQDYSPNYYAGLGGGTQNAQTAILSPAPTSYVNGLEACWLPNFVANSSATPTINFNGLGAITVVKEQSGGLPQALISGDITSYWPACVKYYNSQFILKNPASLYNSGNTITPSPQYQIPFFSGAGTGSTLTGSPNIVTDSGGDLFVQTPVASAVASSPTSYVVGVYQATSGPTYASDSWSLSDQIGSGTNGTSTLQFQHAGTSGATSISFPGLNFNAGTIKANLAATPVTLQSGLNGSTTQGLLTLMGGNVTGGSAAVKGGNVLLTGGSDASTSASSFAGSVQVEAGGSSSNGSNGLVQVVPSFAKGTTVTAGNLECFSSAMTVADCGASPTNVIGVAQGTVSASPISVVTGGEVVVNSSNAATVGHTVCAGSTAGQVTDSGGTAACTLSTGIGVVAAISGTWTLPDGSSAAASSTTPLIVVVRD
jgi:hypothetical protein